MSNYNKFICLFAIAIVNLIIGIIYISHKNATIFTQIKEFYPLTYYESVVTGDSLKLDCSDCAIVTSSGQLLHSNAGHEIDSHECVIRTNDSPTSNYAKDVGLKTTVRIVGFPGRTTFERRLENGEFGENEKNGTYVIGWGPPRVLGKDKPFTVQLIGLQARFPQMHFYQYTNLNWVYEIYNRMTRRKNHPDSVWISTGFFAVVFSRQICNRTIVYGMVDPAYCTRLRNSNGQMVDFPYHYYNVANKTTVKECSYVGAQDRSVKTYGGHKFAQEKKLFQYLAEKDGNIFFKYPEWPK